MITFTLVHSPPTIVTDVFAGAAVGTGAMTGVLTRTLNIASSAVAVGTAEAAIAAIATLAGIAQGAGLMDGSVSPSVALAGSAEAIGVAEGLLEGLGTIEGHAPGVGAAAALISMLIALAGSAAGVGTVAATPTLYAASLDFGNLQNSGLIVLLEDI